MELVSGTLLQAGKYRIIEKLGQGGFGIVYRAHHQGLKRDICIKEFFFSDLCERAQNSLDVKLITKSDEKISIVNSFKKKFIKEAQRLAKFQHINIVQVSDTFEENNTSYIVMEYLQGGSLEDLLSKEGILSEQKTKEIILPVISALEIVHKTDLLHLDIKPANIMFRNNQTPVLIDFGISKYMELSGGNTTSAPVGISKGYAPLEQYGGCISDFTKATDVYSLCATIYKMVVGQVLPEPLQMLSNGFKTPRDLRPEISAQFNAAIVKGLATNKGERHQTMLLFRSALEATIVPLTDPTLTIIEIPGTILTASDEYFKRAEKKRNNKQYIEAIKDYTEAIKIKSNESHYFFYRAWCEGELQNVENAIRDYSTAIELNPLESAAYYNRGLCYLSKGSSYQIMATRDFFRALEIENGNKYFHRWINIVKNSTSTIDSLLETMDKYLSHDWPEKAIVYFERGKKYLDSHKRDKGISDLLKAKELGYTEADELLKRTKWYSTKILFDHCLLLSLNIVFAIGFLILLLHSDKRGQSHSPFIDFVYNYLYGLPLITVVIFSGLYAFVRSFPVKSHSADFREILHPYLPKWFQFLEKINLSISHIFAIGIVINAILSIYSLGGNHTAGIVPTILFLLICLIPIFGLRNIWKKH